MNVTAGLKPDLAFRECLVNVGLPWSANSHFRVAQHHADGVEFMTMQNDRFVRGHFDLIHTHVLIMKSQMVVGLVRKRNDGRRLRTSGEEDKTVPDK